MRITVPRWIRRAFWCFIHDRDEVSPLGVYFSSRQTYERFGDQLLRERRRPPRRRFSDRPIAGAPFYGRTPREYDGEKQRDAGFVTYITKLTLTPELRAKLGPRFSLKALGDFASDG